MHIKIYGKREQSEIFTPPTSGIPRWGEEMNGYRLPHGYPVSPQFQVFAAVFRSNYLRSTRRPTSLIPSPQIWLCNQHTFSPAARPGNRELSDHPHSCLWQTHWLCHNRFGFHKRCGRNQGWFLRQKLWR